MEKIFDIAKDSEQKWGVIAQGIDGNFEELSEKTNKVEQVTNSIIDIPFDTEDGYIHYANGTLQSASTYKSTDYIKCSMLSSITYLLAYADAAGVAFYSEDKSFISGIKKQSTETEGEIVTKSIPGGAFYFRVCYKATYQDKFVLRSAEYISTIVIDKNNINNLKYGLGILEEGYINYSNGVFISASTYRSTGYLRLVGDKVKFSINFKDAAGVVFYSSMKEYIDGYNNSEGTSAYGKDVELDIPSNAKYIRICGLTTRVNYMYLQCVTNSIIGVIAKEDDAKDVNPCFYKETSGCRVFKKILCIGDSLTKGTFEYRDGGSNLTYITDEQLSYPEYLKNLTGRETTNKGTGGLSTKTWWEAHQDDDLSGHDACIIALGRNDYAEGRETTSEERYEYMGYIINKVRNENPQIKVFVATMLNYYVGTAADAVNDDMRDIANKNSCYLLDISAYGKLVRLEDSYSHLTAVGYEKVANYYFNYISYVMATNPDDFKNIQFIGSEHYY